jgi:hypothetical protein
MNDDIERQQLRSRMKMTHQHLSLFGRDHFLFRMIPDPPDQKNKPPRAFTGTLQDNCKELLRANRNGYGIFVQANESDGSGYRHNNIVSAPCFFADLDKVPIGNLDRFPIKPHLIIETSPGKFHAYWPVDGIPLDRFSEMQRRLAELLGSDPVVHDLPRIMRLAGFYHMKNPDAPHLVRIIEQ